MKYYALSALLAVAVVVLIGCTGCDSNPGNTTVDLSTDRTLLCNELGWVAQEDGYTVKDYNRVERDIYFLSVKDNTESNGQFYCTLYSEGSSEDTPLNYLTQGTVTFDGSNVTIEFMYIGTYSLRITASSEDSQPVLSLTAISDEAPIDKMYFSLSGGI